MPVLPDMLLRSKFLTASTTVSLSTTTAKSSQLLRGLYWVSASADCFFLQGPTAVTATTSSVPLWAKTWVRVHVEDSTLEGFIAGITASGTATLYIVKAE